MDETCAFCEKPPRREQKVDGRSLYIIDCKACGVYQIGGTSRARLRTLRDERSISNAISHIRQANAEGYLFEYPRGRRIAGHPWLNIRNAG
jgi:hypothetical protein